MVRSRAALLAAAAGLSLGLASCGDQPQGSLQSVESTLKWEELDATSVRGEAFLPGMAVGDRFPLILRGYDGKPSRVVLIDPSRGSIEAAAPLAEDGWILEGYVAATNDTIALVSQRCSVPPIPGDGADECRGETSGILLSILKVGQEDWQTVALSVGTVAPRIASLSDTSVVLELNSSDGDGNTLLSVDLERPSAVPEELAASERFPHTCSVTSGPAARFSTTEPRQALLPNDQKIVDLPQEFVPEASLPPNLNCFSARDYLLLPADQLFPAPEAGGPEPEGTAEKVEPDSPPTTVSDQSRPVRGSAAVVNMRSGVRVASFDTTEINELVAGGDFIGVVGYTDLVLVTTDGTTIGRGAMPTLEVPNWKLSATDSGLVQLGLDKVGRLQAIGIASV